ncbi:MAG: ABC transporter ATP-binding protein [Bacteroidota bacterium]|nr:ABC transporter ATP-binding protein [Bacteroidota bacterium]
MHILTLKNISKSFESTEVLKNISFELIGGEFFSVVGPSGCGKTTLLRIIAGLEFATSGEILIRDTIASHLPPQKRNIGIVFQNYALFPNMTVFENVAYGLEVRKLPKDKIKERVDSVLEKVRMSHKADISVTTLSGGEQQRVSLARVIVTEPALLLFDEPLSNLDYALRIETRNEIKRLQRDIGITSVYVTHDQSEALALSDRIAVLNKGVMQQIGTPHDVYYKPENIFTAEFIGHSNLFDKHSAKESFDLDINEGEVLSIFPEELIPEKCREDCKAKIADIQFTGFSIEYLIEVDGRMVKALQPSDFKKDNFEIGENVHLSFNTKNIRLLKK